MVLCTFAHMLFRRCFWVLLLLPMQLMYSQENLDTKTPKLVETSTSIPKAFTSGEWFKFRIHYGIFNASFATIELKETTWEGKRVYHAKGVGKTTGLARWFFKVDDYYESYFDKQEVRPLYFIRNINEGGYKKHLTIRFDHENKTATVNDLLKQQKGTYQTKPNIQDLISCFYYLRENLDISKIKKNDFVVVNMFFDSENYAFKFKFLGNDVIKTKFGFVKALKFRPYVQSGRVFRSSESITLWVSSDKNKIPLRLEASLRVGSITADLDEFKGLKNPFNIVVQN